ncbi:distal tail protein Dit [Paenibacillus lentus]|uniref:Phage tail protein n=1 Tax=Paenibacillus lentus TaxID=1338368 RepID=A0A3Q8SBS6_9BACL|nr:distal tail protein Dit [Paenibacillus lentus]AZK47117.1 phage tail protein [Paenibacillus lentus]
MFYITVRDSLYFSYAGRVSAEFGILNVSLSGDGMSEEPLAASREIHEVSIKGRDQPYFQGIEKDPLRFNVSFAFQERFNTQKLREVARWLTEHEYYQPLFFTNDLGVEPEKIYYALVVDEPALVHNSLQQGYITLTFRCDSPYAYSPRILSKKYDWADQPFTNRINHFSNNTHERTGVDPAGHLVLTPSRTTWADIPSGTRWTDL